MSTDTVDSTGKPPEVPGPFGAPVPTQEAGPALRADTLNLFDSTVVAVSSVALLTVNYGLNFATTALLHKY